jgi:tetratricopeptide (TPR) repeat protein
LGDQESAGSQNMLKLAIEQYETIIKIEPDSVEDHLLLGRLYRLNNDLQKAESEFKTAVKLQPDSEEAVTMLAYLYNDEGDATRATQVLSSMPDTARSAKLYSALGYTYEQQKDYKKAIEAYRRAIELDRDNLDAIRGLAQNLMNNGQTDAALEQYKIIADANPEDAGTYLRIAEIYRKAGKFDLALENLKKAESMVQDSIEVPYNIAAVYQAQGRYDEAIQVLQGLLKKTEKPDGNYTQPEKNNRTVFLERLGTIYRENRNDQAALDTFRKMLPLGDDNPTGRHGTDRCWLPAGQVDAQRYPGRPRGLHRAGANEQPLEALDRGGGRPEQGGTAFHQAGGQALSLLFARFNLRAPEKVR